MRNGDVDKPMPQKQDGLNDADENQEPGSQPDESFVKERRFYLSLQNQTLEILVAVRRQLFVNPQVDWMALQHWPMHI